VPPPLVEPIPGLNPEAVEAAADDVRTLCGWHIAPSVEEVLTVDGPGGRVLILPTLWVTAITAIVDDGVTLPATNAYTWGVSGVVRRIDGGFWSTKQRAIAVSLSHGYPACPPAVRREVARVAAAPAGGPVALTSGQLGQLQVSYGAPSIDVPAIASYRLLAR